ncbi:M15 family metallopeptidase [Nocardioides sp.]|uniref:M15 family metallopeptidase n=1 Tax=Nocardioides sp. TaxID=35761 RepID=UPI003784A74B
MRLGRALVTAALAAAVGLAASGCDDGSAHAGDPAGSGSSASTGSGRSSGSTSAPTSPSGGATPTGLDPEHAVDPPGRRTGLIAPADIVANGSATIPDDKVAAIRHLDGVLGVEQIALASVPIENRALSVAAVDPATYRNWVTDANSAQTAAVWDRVAGGELALRPALRKRTPIADDGFLALGSTEDADRVHVGAYAQQSWLVDAVVNDTWIPTLDMTPGNALLIRTGGTSPERLRKPIERILRGTEASVQMTDVVAREGLDPGAVQTAVVVGTIADAVGTFRYTVLAGGHIAPAADWVSAHIATEPVPLLGNVTCNKLIFPQLRAALEDVIAQGLADKIHPSEYAGCYYPRFIAGTTTLSNHAFGLALDLNVPGNQRGTAGEIDRGVVAIFKHWGFTWGGDWAYTDPMHFEMNHLVRPQ